MKQNVMVAAGALCAFGCLGAVEVRPGAVDVVVETKAPPAVRFAADELTNFLAQAFGAAVPIVGEPSDRTAIVLGDNKWSREAGIDVDSKPRDTFFIKTAPNRVYLAGRDHPRHNPLVAPSFSRSLERATSFAVYAFLEDYAGVRFYFPGELGTIVPKKSLIVVPDVDRAVTPDFSVREWYSGKKAFWFGKAENDAEGERMKRLDWLRLRMGTKKIPLCHGTINFKYVERFGKTHPEYFSLKTNGLRTIESAIGHSGHLCWTSPIVEEIYQDVKAALTGKKPSDRGIPLKNWGNNVDLEDGIVDIMPQDGQPDCACENCQKLYRAGEDPVWLATKSIAERLTADGVKGTVTQMCYGRSRKVPAYDLPSNILVQVAIRGQWSTGRPDLIAGERKQITDWMDKLGHKVWLWTYPGKHPSVGPDFDGIPQLSMHAWGKYYSDAADYIIGGFSESETDRFSFNYLNYYVYSRVCWDAKTDIDAVLDEHYRLMFGAAAPEMKELYTILETRWMTKLTGESKDTPIGPVAVVPSWKTIFAEIYPPSEVARLDDIVATALSKVGADSLEARRIRLISDEFIGGIKAAAKAYHDRVTAVEGFRASAGEDIPLRVFAPRGKKPDIDRTIETKVRTWTDEKAIYATFTSEEPNMDKAVAKMRPRDNGEIWADNSVEWYFCPTGDRTVYYHIGVNSEGAIFDNKNNSLGTRGGSIDKSWGEGVTATVENGEGSWKCTVAVPFAAIGGRPVGAVPSLFARNRVVDGVRGSALYVWGPESVSSFGNSENYGRVEYASAERTPTTLTPGNTEVLVAPEAQATRAVAWFAAGEMTNFLSRALGRAVPLVTTPTPGNTAVVVGANAWSEAAGIDVGKLPRDGFVVKGVPGRIFIAGRDVDGPFNPAKDWKGGEKATLFGVYDFLERYVGCRFYFPGEIGEVVPRVASVSVPEGERVDAPEFIERKVRYSLGKWFDPVSKAQYEMNEALCHYRWRLQTRGIPCCHGLQHGHYLARFGKTHPEYFCLRKDGTRMNDENGSLPGSKCYRGQYCHSSAIWDEIFKDARSYFLGEGPEVRGMMAERNQKVVPGHEWRWQAAHGMYYDVMPQDNFQRCWCEKCAAAFAKAKDPAQYATELVWGRVAECAQRLIDEGIPGCLTMMSYNPYKNVPDFNIPTNVLVMVCSNGAWAKERFQKNDLGRLQAWNEKCGRKLHIWNNCGKHVCFNLNYADMPGITPRAYGSYYKRLAPYIFGAYCDNESEKFIYSALNYYVFSRLAWNSSVDVDALLGEYYRLMFGKGADAMRRFDEELEDIWMNEIISTQIETALGPMNAGISSFELWSRVVDMKRIRRFEALFGEAMQAVEPGSMEARRIQFFHRQILKPMVVRARELDQEGGVERELAARKSRNAVSVLDGFVPVEFSVSTTNQAVHSKAFRLMLKGGRTYRVSYFISGENLDQYGDSPEQLRIAKMWGGVLGSVKAGGNTLGVVGRGIRGTFKPVVQAFDIVAPGADGEETDAELKLQTVWTTGHVKIDLLMVEEQTYGM